MPQWSYGAEMSSHDLWSDMRLEKEVKIVKLGGTEKKNPWLRAKSAPTRGSILHRMPRRNPSRGVFCPERFTWNLIQSKMTPLRRQPMAPPKLIV